MDKIYFNGTIHSLDENEMLYSAIGIADGKIAFLGSNEEAKQLNAA